MEIAESTITGDRLVYGLELENESSSRGEEPGVASFKLGVWSGGVVTVGLENATRSSPFDPDASYHLTHAQPSGAVMKPRNGG